MKNRLPLKYYRVIFLKVFGDAMEMYSNVGTAKSIDYAKILAASSPINKAGNTTMDKVEFFCDVITVTKKTLTPGEQDRLKRILAKADAEEFKLLRGRFSAEDLEIMDKLGAAFLGHKLYPVEQYFKK